MTLRGSMRRPLRKMKQTRPRRSRLDKGESGQDTASPRVRMPEPEGACPVPMTRWATSLLLRTNKTISPSETSSPQTRPIMRVSPGHMVGSMLQPVTRKLRYPDERKTSLASSHLTAVSAASLVANVMTLSGGPNCTSIGCRTSYTKEPLSRTPARNETTAFRTVSW